MRIWRRLPFRRFSAHTSLAPLRNLPLLAIALLQCVSFSGDYAVPSGEGGQSPGRGLARRRRKGTNRVEGSCSQSGGLHAWTCIRMYVVLLFFIPCFNSGCRVKVFYFAVPKNIFAKLVYPPTLPLFSACACVHVCMRARAVCVHVAFSLIVNTCE